MLWFDVQTEVVPRGYDFVNNRGNTQIHRRVILKSLYNSMHLKIGEINKMSVDGRKRLQRTMNAIIIDIIHTFLLGKMTQILNCNIVIIVVTLLLVITN